MTQFRESQVQTAVNTLLWSNDLMNKKVSKSLIARIRREWKAFMKTWETIGFNPEDHILSWNSNNGDEYDHAAHDWILTRNGEGAGFWDGDWDKEMGEQLTRICKTQGHIEVFCNRGFVQAYDLVSVSTIATTANTKYKKNSSDLMIQLPEIDSHWRKIRGDVVVINGEEMRYNKSSTVLTFPFLSFCVPNPLDRNSI
jgi:hypothetical protein